MLAIQQYQLGNFAWDVVIGAAWQAVVITLATLWSRD